MTPIVASAKPATTNTGSAAAQIVRADLIDVQRYQVHRRMMVGSVPSVSFEKPVDDVLRVRMLVINRDDGR